LILSRVTDIDGLMSIDEAWHDNESFDSDVYGGRTKKWHITEKNEFDALRFLDQRPKEKPFFLHVGFYATHAVDNDPRQYIPQHGSLAGRMYDNSTIPVPFTSRNKSWRKMRPMLQENNEGRTRYRWRYDTPDKFQRMMKNYYYMATEVDTTCGRILQKLQDQGELDNTLVIFTTDNGNFHAEHGLADKWYPHQESIRVPLIIKDPRMPKSKIGTTQDDFTLNIDLTPTILAAAGRTALPRMMGRDISLLYREDNEEKEETVTTPSDTANNNNNNKAHAPIRDFPWRTEFFYEHPIINDYKFIPASEALVRKDWKYMWWPNFKREQLFDLVHDPKEDADWIPYLKEMMNGNTTDATTDTANQKHKHKHAAHHTQEQVWTILNEMRTRFQELKAVVRNDNYSSVTL
jgi:arylsulfatase